MLPKKTFDTGEITIFYEEGPNDGPPLVMLHGLTSGIESWEQMIPTITPSWHVYACDLRGHGQSGHVAEKYNLIDYAPDTIAFLQKQVDAPAVLIGHSLGAWISLVVAAKTPELVRALVLLDPPLSIYRVPIATDPGAYGWFSFVYETIKSNPSLDDIIARCRTMMGPQVPDVAVRAMAEHLQTLDPGTVAAALHDTLLEGFDTVNELRGIACPTLLLRGDPKLGGAIHDEDVKFFHENVPHATIINIPNAGHNVHGDQFEVVMGHINDFLRTV